MKLMLVSIPNTAKIIFQTWWFFLKSLSEYSASIRNIKIVYIYERLTCLSSFFVRLPLLILYIIFDAESKNNIFILWSSFILQ